MPGGGPPFYLSTGCLSTHWLASRQTCELIAQLVLRTGAGSSLPLLLFGVEVRSPLCPPAPYTLLSLFRCLHVAPTWSQPIARGRSPQKPFRWRTEDK